MARMAAAAYTAVFFHGTATAVRRGYRAEPLGLRTGLSPLTDALAGNGTALSAPWPMILVLWHSLAASRAQAGEGRRGRARLALLASLFLAGAVAEPVSHRLLKRQLPRDVAAIALLNVALPAVMLIGALSSLVDSQNP